MTIEQKVNDRIFAIRLQINKWLQERSQLELSIAEANADIRGMQMVVSMIKEEEKNK